MQTHPSRQATLYDALKAAGIETASHASELYFPATPKALAILRTFPIQKSGATSFINQAPPNVGERWINVPFAYQPFWDKVIDKAVESEKRRRSASVSQTKTPTVTGASQSTSATKPPASSPRENKNPSTSVS